MTREQTAREHSDRDAPERETIPPDGPREGKKPIAASGDVAYLNPMPITPRPAAEEDEIALQSGGYAAPPRRSLWTGFSVVVGLIVVAGIVAAFLSA